MPEGATVHYVKMVEQIMAIKKNKVEIKNVFVRMRQCCSGFLGMNDETGAKIEMALPENPKLDLLMDLIMEMPEGAKAVVFHDFIWSGAAIERGLGERKISCGRLWSGTKNPGETLAGFNATDGFQVLIANNQSAAYGLNLQRAHYVFFYESPTSMIDRQQAERRCRRAGQKSDKVFIYDLVTRKSVESKLLEYMEAGKDLFAAIIDGKILKEDLT